MNLRTVLLSPLSHFFPKIIDFSLLALSTNYPSSQEIRLPYDQTQTSIVNMDMLTVGEAGVVWIFPWIAVDLAWEQFNSSTQLGDLIQLIVLKHKSLIQTFFLQKFPLLYGQVSAEYWTELLIYCSLKRIKKDTVYIYSILKNYLIYQSIYHDL